MQLPEDLTNPGKRDWLENTIETQITCRETSKRKRASKGQVVKNTLKRHK